MVLTLAAFLTRAHRLFLLLFRWSYSLHRAAILTRAQSIVSLSIVLLSPSRFLSHTAHIVFLLLTVLLGSSLTLSLSLFFSHVHTEEFCYSLDGPTLSLSLFFNTGTQGSFATISMVLLSLPFAAFLTRAHRVFLFLFLDGPLSLSLSLFFSQGLREYFCYSFARGNPTLIGGYVPRGFPKVGSRERVFLEK